MLDHMPCTLAVRAWRAGPPPVDGSEALHDETDGPPSVFGRAHSGGPQSQAIEGLLAAARKAYDFAERKSAALTSGLSSDPTWLMMLDLFISHAEGTRLSVTDLCIGSRASPATALRYLSLLERSDYAIRIADPTDRRRSYVRLTDRGACTVIGLLS